MRSTSAFVYSNKNKSKTILWSDSQNEPINEHGLKAKPRSDPWQSKKKFRKTNPKILFDWRLRMNQSKNIGLQTNWKLTNGKVGFLYTNHHVLEPVTRRSSALRYFNKNWKKNDWSVRMKQLVNMGLTTDRELTNGKAAPSCTGHQAS